VAKRVGRRGLRLDVARQRVIGSHSGKRDQEANAGRDQCFSDAGHHGLRALRGVQGEIVERPDDAEDRAEQANEGRIRAEGAEEREPALVA
jgi:hypothetical protein